MLKGHMNTDILVFSIAILIDALSNFSLTFRFQSDLNVHMSSISNLFKLTAIESEDKLEKEYD